MLEDDNTRLGTQTAGQGGALIADGMAVTLLVGGDAGIGGDVSEWDRARRPPEQGS